LTNRNNQSPSVAGKLAAADTKPVATAIAHATCNQIAEIFLSIIFSFTQKVQPTINIPTGYFPKFSVIVLYLVENKKRKLHHKINIILLKPLVILW